MLQIRQGRDLPDDTMVYISIDTYDRVYKHKIRHLQLAYIFNSKDGLWATQSARITWRRHPHLHPHCTLFYLLYKKLES